MDTSPAQALGRYFRAIALSPNVSTLDWFSYIGAIPSATGTRDNIIVLYDSAPITDGRDHRTGDFILHPGIQVRVRSKGYDVGWAKIQAIKTALELINGQSLTVNGETIKLFAFNLTSGPMSMGQEEQNLRNHFALNGTLTLKEI